MVRKECSNKSIYKNNKEYICNPKSGRFVKKSGPIGKSLSGKRSVRRRSVRRRSVRRRSVRRRSVRRRSKLRVPKVKSKSKVEMGGMDATQQVDSLEKNGYVVLPVPWLNPKNLSKIRKQMLTEMEKFPEYIPNKKLDGVPNPYVMGGFSALCNPASFHNPFVRKMRMCALRSVLPFFSEYTNKLGNKKQWKLEQVVDRMLFRPKGISATSESWHRDEAALALDSDKIFGGWWNFDDTDQHFSCVPGTHKGVRGHSGFAAIKNKKDKDNYTKNKFKVVIPPGHIMVFYEHLIHEVLGKKSKQDMYRLFLGWRVTKSKESLYPLETRLDDQAVMPLKSNQIPPMYATLHWTNWRPKIVAFSRNLKPICIESRRVMSGKDKGKTYDIVQRNMQSLKDYKLKLYKPYSKNEIDLLKPSTNWTVDCFGKLKL
jgi:hypothetical protein